MKDYQKRAQQNYINKFDIIQIRAPKGNKEKFNIYADRLGLSLNEFIVYALQKECRIDLFSNPLVNNHDLNRAELTTKQKETTFEPNPDRPSQTPIARGAMRGGK